MDSKGIRCQCPRPPILELLHDSHIHEAGHFSLHQALPEPENMSPRNYWTHIGEHCRSHSTPSFARESIWRAPGRARRLLVQAGRNYAWLNGCEAFEQQWTVLSATYRSQPEFLRQRMCAHSTAPDLHRVRRLLTHPV